MNIVLENLFVKILLFIIVVLKVALKYSKNNIILIIKLAY